MHEKKQKFFSIFRLLIAVALIYPCLSIYAESYSSIIFEKLRNNGFYVEYQGLTPSEPRIFPQNVIIHTVTHTDNAEEVILSFTQEHISKCENQFIDFMNDIKTMNLSFSLTILLSACDEGIFYSKEDLFHPHGTQVFTSSLTDSSVRCSVVVQEKDSSIHNIIAGGNGDVSPLWLVKLLKESCTTNEESFFIPNSASFLYRLHLIDNNHRVSAFLNQSIPTAGITVGYSEGDFKILTNMLLLLQSKMEQSLTAYTWDRHYSYIYIPVINLELWINETFFVFSFMLLSTFILFFICFSSFSKTQKNIAILKDLLRTWYLIPIFIILTALCLQYTQQFFTSITDSPVFLAGLKTIATFLIFNIIFLLQITLSLRVSYNVNKYTIILISAINIFIFCSIDISFMFLFLVEFLICFIACRTSGIISIFITFLLMLLPFVPSAINLLSASNYQALIKFSAPKLTGNMLIACIIFPFEIQWQRLLIVLRKRFKTFIPIVITLLFLVCIFIGVFFYGINSISPLSEKTERSDPVFSIKDEDNFVLISTDREDFLDFNINTLTIKASEDVSVIRYNIIIEAEDTVPLYECNYEYEVITREKIFIKTPDLPEYDVSIVYTCDKDTEQTITVTSYLKTTDGHLLKESDVITVNRQK